MKADKFLLLQSKGVFKNTWYHFPSFLISTVCLIIYSTSLGADVIQTSLENSYKSNLLTFSTLVFVYMMWYSSNQIDDFRNKQRNQEDFIKRRRAINAQYYLKRTFAQMLFFGPIIGLVYDDFLAIVGNDNISPLAIKIISFGVLIGFIFTINLLYSKYLHTRYNTILLISFSLIMIGLDIELFLSVPFQIVKYLILFFLSITVFQSIHFAHQFEKRKFPHSWKQTIHGIKNGDIKVIFFNLFIIVTAALYVLSLTASSFKEYLAPSITLSAALCTMFLIGQSLTWLNFRILKKHNLNAHFILIVLSMGSMFSKRDPYQINTLASEPHKTYYHNRVDIKEALKEKTSDDNTKYIILADGGASRSGYWTSMILDSLHNIHGDKFYDNILCISSVSGGTIGCLSYFGHLDHFKRNSLDKINSHQFFDDDFLSPILPRLLSTDVLNHAIFYTSPLMDRGNLLAYLFEHSQDSIGSTYFKQPVENILLNHHNKKNTPLLFINTTCRDNGRSAIFCNAQFNPHTSKNDIYNGRMDILSDSAVQSKNISVGSMAVLSSSFPYISPAGGLGEYHFVDGGYFDNSGAGIIYDMLIENEELLKNTKICFIHCENNTHMIEENRNYSPIINDLFTPFLTVLQTYGSQTDLNNHRLKGYISKKKNWQYYSLNLLDESKTNKVPINWVLSKQAKIDMHKRLQKGKNSIILDSIIQF